MVMNVNAQNWTYFFAALISGGIRKTWAKQRNLTNHPIFCKHFTWLGSFWTRRHLNDQLLSKRHLTLGPTNPLKKRNYSWCIISLINEEPEIPQESFPHEKSLTYTCVLNMSVYRDIWNHWRGYFPPILRYEDHDTVLGKWLKNALFHYWVSLKPS